ncbi:hypothetical protein ACGF5C_33720 [Micromonospora sp. NPDC047620]|uniref:hypothetical protein n=1 Tax=Micromonospora sp. NPDC047620 TaxID=3364251 RepID=UPI003719A661
MASGAAGRDGGLPHTHLPIALGCLAAGGDLLPEKPPVLSTADTVSWLSPVLSTADTVSWLSPALSTAGAP